jgi:hypothetical protein
VIELSRDLARRFRSVLRRTLSDLNARSSWPLLICRSGPDGLTVDACQEEIAVRYHAEGTMSAEAIAFRSTLLSGFEGRTEEPVRLEQTEAGKGRASWTDGGVPRTIEFDTVAVDSAPAFPSLPRHMVSMTGHFLQALDEAAKTTARDSVRLALSRVQLRGSAGEIAATDGRQLLVQRGFELPWEEDLLVPRLTVFGSRDLAAAEPIHLGRTKTHVALQVGSWTLLLTIDTASCFPGIESVIPRSNKTAIRLRLDPADAEFLAATLPRLPGQDADQAPVTIDFGTPVRLRAQADGKGPVTEVELSRSTASGPSLRVPTDGRYLLRAVKLGFQEVQVAKADMPLVCRDAQRIYVWMPLGPEAVLPPRPDAVTIRSAEDAVPTPPPVTERRKRAMPVPRDNGHKPDNGHSNDGLSEPENNHAADRPPEQWGIGEVMAEMEGLRTVLQDACTRTTRLLIALKARRRQSRAMQAAMASLKQLQLDP